MDKALKNKVNILLKEKSLTIYDLEKTLNYSRGAFSQMFSGKRAFPENIIKKLLPILEISREELDSWIIADKYSKEVIELAIKVKQEKSKVCHPALDAGSNKQAKYTDQSGINTNGKILNQVQDDKGKLILTIKIDAILEKKEMSRTNLAKQIKYSQSGLNRMIIGEIGLSKSVLAKVSEALEIPQDEILSWTVADKYSLEILKMAYENK